ncbi:DUF6262 family protein [Streptomyces sp. NPDC055808]
MATASTRSLRRSRETVAQAYRCQLLGRGPSNAAARGHGETDPRPSVARGQSPRQRNQTSRVLKTLDEMAATGEKITPLALARTARVSNWLVYTEGLREHIEDAIKKQGGAAQRETGEGLHTSAESLAADLELATAELRLLRAERDQLKAAMAQLRETEAERDRLREALKESEEKLESTLKENRLSSNNRTERGQAAAGADD